MLCLHLFKHDMFLHTGYGSRGGDGGGGRRDDLSSQQPLLMRAAPVIGNPAVPQRTASLSYSTGMYNQSLAGCNCFMQ